MELDGTDGVEHVIVVVIATHITFGEQLTLDYGLGYWAAKSDQPVTL